MKFDLYQFDSETWVVTVSYKYATLEYCTCTDFYGQQTSAHYRALAIVEALNAMDKVQTEQKQQVTT